MSETISHNLGLHCVSVGKVDCSPRLGDSLMCILVVDDEELVRNSVCEYLESIGYVAVGAVNGQHALQLAEQIGPSIQAVVSDVEMPGLNGPAMWEQLKILVPSQCKILFISGRANVLNQLPDLPGELLVKPFSMHVLEQKLATMINPTH